jgi:hypothetical protein
LLVFFSFNLINLPCLVRSVKHLPTDEGKIKIGYSNEVFELWLLLHFTDVSSEKPIPRIEIYSRLEAEIKSTPAHKDFVYEHGKTEVIDVLLKIGNESKAIIRAEKLYGEQKEKQPIDANPNTSVFILIKRLRELVEWYSYIPEKN